MSSSVTGLTADWCLLLGGGGRLEAREVELWGSRWGAWRRQMSSSVACNRFDDSDLFGPDLDLKMLPPSGRCEESHAECDSLVLIINQPNRGQP